METPQWVDKKVLSAMSEAYYASWIKERQTVIDLLHTLEKAGVITWDELKDGFKQYREARYQ